MTQPHSAPRAPDRFSVSNTSPQPSDSQAGPEMGNPQTTFFGGAHSADALSGQVFGRFDGA